MATYPIFLLAYVIGSIPFGMILMKISGFGDIRQVGSGNIGATNVLRSGHRWLALVTLLLDGLKGYVAVWMAENTGLSLESVCAAGFVAVFAHVFPVWLGFKGGKGVATAAGALLALDAQMFMVFAGAWLALFVLWRFASVASILAFWVATVPPLVGGDSPLLLLGVILATFITFTHRANIKRLYEGNEAGFKKTA